jgi:acetyl-CoA synthetase
MERSYIGPAFDDAQVHHAMRVGVITCRPQTRLSDVAKMMVGYDAHSVVVADVDEGGLWGIVTSLDLARSADQLDELSAADVASTDLITIPSNASLREAGKLMDEHRISHLVAVQPEDGRPAGVISSRDLAAAAAFGRS